MSSYNSDVLIIAKFRDGLIGGKTCSRPCRCFFYPLLCETHLAGTVPRSTFFSLIPDTVSSRIASRILLTSGSTKSSANLVAYPAREGHSWRRRSLTNSARSKSGKATHEGNEERERPRTSDSEDREDSLCVRSREGFYKSHFLQKKGGDGSKSSAQLLHVYNVFYVHIQIIVGKLGICKYDIFFSALVHIAGHIVSLHFSSHFLGGGVFSIENYLLLWRRGGCWLWRL